MRTILQFLSEISGTNNPLRAIPDGHLRYHATSNYQTILEVAFGPDGHTVTPITQNEILSPGVKSLLLKIAILASPEECYHFLHFLYACVVAKKPGYYWDVVKCIKLINDHCNNTPHYRSLDNSCTFKDYPCQQLFFRESAGDIEKDPVAPCEFRIALQTLIKSEIRKLADTAKADPTIGYELYKDQQLVAARILDSMSPNLSWMMIPESITEQQILATRFAPLINAWQARNKMVTDALLGCIFAPDPWESRMHVVLSAQKQFEDAEKQILKCDFNRSLEEAALQREITAHRKKAAKFTAY